MAVSAWSSSTFIETGDAWLEAKIERALGLDPVRAYPTQLLEYKAALNAETDADPGIVDYKRHTDCGGELDPNARAITLLMYLTAADENENKNENGGGGGDTVFPRIGNAEGLSVRPVAGRLVVFTSLTDRGFCDSRSQHYSRGGGFASGKNKIAVQKWYTRRPQRKSKADANVLARRFLQGVKEMGLLQESQTFVSCDGSGSCREFVPWVAEEESGGATDEL